MPGATNDKHFSTFLRETEMKRLFRWYVYFSNFSGRMSRGGFLIFFFMWLFLLILTAWFVSSSEEFSKITMALYFLVTMIPVLSVSVKRLHDMGLNGFWLIVFFASGVGFIALMLTPGRSGENKYGPNPHAN
jgi:uncharacterized membrane protein YhaH (DUF805 family)